MKRVCQWSFTFFLPLFCVSSLTFAHLTAGALPKLEVPASEDAMSAPFEMDKDQWIKVKVSSSGESDSSRRPVIYIYRDSNKELMGMSNPDADNDELFKWTAPEATRYYARIHNPASTAAAVLITIMPPGAKGVVGGQLAAGAEVRVFYATNRQQLNTDADDAKYGTEPAQDGQIHYGNACVTIPHDHRMGELEGPSIYKLEFHSDPNKHITMGSAKSERLESFNKELKAAVSSAKSKEIFVFVHGFNVSFEEAVRRTGQIQYDLGLGGNAVLFSWPSQASAGIVSYNKDGRNAELSAPVLRGFLEELADQSGASAIHLIAHSMGNRIAVKALADMGNAQKSIRHVALMAPDIDAQNFMQMAKRMKSPTNDITLYASDRDEALKLSKTLNGYARAGDGGNNILVMPGVFETIDASTVDTGLLGLLHSYYADNSTILSDVFQLIRGSAASVRFGLQELKTSSGSSYWSFRPSAR